MAIHTTGNEASPYRAENERLVQELATYRHAFETTATDRDRWKKLATEQTGKAPGEAASIEAADAVPNATPALPPIDLGMQHRLKRQLQSRQYADHYFFIDVVGSCNLKCPACAVGNTIASLPKGLMSPTTLSEILEKIRREYSEFKRMYIDLYNWGEPGIHPQLSKLVQLAKSKQFGVGISSNFNVFPDLRDVVKAGPDCLRISISGMKPSTYDTTHQGGNIHAVKSNLYRLRELLDRYSSPTIVQMGFHVYRTNFPDDFLSARALCDELGYIFAPVLGTIMPAERVIRMAQRKPTTAIGPVKDKLVLSVEDVLEVLRNASPTSHDCQFRQSRTTINFDGSVSLCSASYESPSNIGTDFRAMSRKEVEAAKYSNPLCAPCMEHQVNKLYTGMHVPERNAAAVSVLGPLFGAYLDETRHVGNPNYITFDGKLLTVSDVYARGLAALSQGSLGWPEARRCFDALVDGAPEFGEGYFQSAALAALQDDHGLALTHAQEAVRQLPGNPNYVALLQRLEAAASPARAVA